MCRSTTVTNNAVDSVENVACQVWEGLFILARCPVDDCADAVDRRLGRVGNMEATWDFIHNGDEFSTIEAKLSPKLGVMGNS